MSAPFADYQNEIYLYGAAGVTPELPVSWAELERLAGQRLDPRAWGYVAGGAGAEQTMRANSEAFDRWRIAPRMLRGVTARDLATELLGTVLPAPVLLAPVGVMEIVHPDAELAVARAAAALGVPMVLSTASSTPMEQVAQTLGESPRWFQLYWPRDRELAASLVHRAEAAGYSALVVTLDTWLLGWWPRDLAQAYLPFLTGQGLANYLTDPVFRAGLAAPPEEDPGGAVRHFVGLFSDPALTWADLDFLRATTRLPIVVKGVCHADDARLAVDAGMSGLVVSNHGGRQVDGATGALDQLPEVVEAVAGAVPVLFDSGVRGGADAVKAMALGAQAVLLGRPYLWGLAVAGEAGVRHVLRMFLAELDITLGLSGHACPGDLTAAALVRAPRR